MCLLGWLQCRRFGLERYTVTDADYNEVQSVTIAAAGGHWHAIFDGSESAAINYDASAEE